ncbi:hypothetical protein EGR52_11645 [bacterium]|nr:hypothetical protein [bacterium]
MDKIKKTFERIKNYLNNVFNRKNIKLIEANTRVIQNESNSDGIYEEQIETDKEDFFTVYKNLKFGKIKITDLMINDLLKIQLMMQKEVDIMNDKIEGLENELIELDTEKSVLEKDKQIYIEKIREDN